ADQRGHSRRHRAAQRQDAQPDYITRRRTGLGHRGRSVGGSPRPAASRRPPSAKGHRCARKARKSRRVGMTAFGAVVGNLAHTAPARVALTCGARTISRAALETRTNRLARAYRQLGVTPDSFVTIGLPNGIQFFEAVLAVWKLGATPQPISSRLPA